MRRVRCKTCENEDLVIVDVIVASRGVAPGDDLPTFDAVRIRLHCEWGCPDMIMTVASGRSWPEVRMSGYETPFHFFVKNSIETN